MRKKGFFAGKATRIQAARALGNVILLDATDATERGEVDGLVVVDEALLVVVRST